MGAAAVGRMMGRKGDVGEAELAPSGGPAYDTAAQSYTAERPGVSERVPMPGSVEEVEGQLPKVVPVEIGPGEGLGLMGATAPVVGDAARVLEGTRQEGEVIGFTPGGGVERYQPDLEAELASAGLKARGVSGREGAEEAREELRAEGDEARERRGGELATLCAARPQSVKPHGVAGGCIPVCCALCTYGARFALGGQEDVAVHVELLSHAQPYLPRAHLRQCSPRHSSYAHVPTHYLLVSQVASWAPPPTPSRPPPPPWAWSRWRTRRSAAWRRWPTAPPAS